jgi:hypothetical protein
VEPSKVEVAVTSGDSRRREYGKQPAVDGYELEWTARHLHNECEQVRSWSHLKSLVSNVGTTDWPWLTVFQLPRAPNRRYVQCLGFADALVAEVSAWDPVSNHERLWRLGFEKHSPRWFDVDPLAEFQVRARTSQVLTADQAVAAFREWFDYGHVGRFDLEEVDL